jgi:hypothetical protein
MLGHLFHYLLRESARLCGGPDENVRLDLLDYGEQFTVLFSLPFFVITCVCNLRWGEILLFRLQQ